MLAVSETGQRDSFESLLQKDLGKVLLRFTTAGSVDDGKSTLIGRLLHDSKAVYEDQLTAVRKSRINRSGKAIDFSLLTDGLQAEREQGITIDVAYRYFSTPRRKFIIADTPGHEQYTRNMATGASTADLAIVLVDATKGLLPQTLRHAYIAALLGIPNVVAAVNKMDLVDYREDVFLRLETDFSALAHSLRIPFVHAIPVSALEGDNVVARSTNMPWYRRATLIEHLETVEVQRPQDAQAIRFPIQRVIRPDASFRGFAGRVASGMIRPGDVVLALPSEHLTRIETIVGYDGNLEVAIPSQSVVLKLAGEIDLSRGDMLVSADAPPKVANRFTAMIVWLEQQALELNRTYLLKHAGRLVKAKAQLIRYQVDVNELTHAPADKLEMNGIASVEFETTNPLFFDAYEENRTTGSFILIDTLSNATVGAGMITENISESVESGWALRTDPAENPQSEISLRERHARHGHPSAIVFVGGERAVANRLEKRLFERNFEAICIHGTQITDEALSTVISSLISAGLIVVYVDEGFSPERRSICESVAGKLFFDFSHATNSERDDLFREALDLAETLRLKTALEHKTEAD